METHRLRVRLMKHVLAWLALGAALAMPCSWAADAAAVAVAAVTPSTESDNSAITSLCKTYASDDKVAASMTDTYVKKCVASMTDLSDTTQAALPLVGEDGSPAATPESAKVTSSPEQLVKGEIVETPDPTAEQLSASSKL